MNLHAASGVVWDTIRDWYYSMIGLAALNLLWIGACLTIVLFPPATAGAYAMTNSIARGKGQQWDVFMNHARRYGWISVRWALLNGVVIAIFAVNVMFYGSAEGMLSAIAQIVLVTGGVLWAAMQFYFWPFMLEQEQKSVYTALKNALFLTLAEPLYTVVMLSTAALVIVLSVVLVLPIAVVALSFIALLANRAVIERLTAYGKLRHPANGE